MRLIVSREANLPNSSSSRAAETPQEHRDVPLKLSREESRCYYIPLQWYLCRNDDTSRSVSCTFESKINCTHVIKFERLNFYASDEYIVSCKYL